MYTHSNASYFPKFGLGFVLQSGIKGAEGPEAENAALKHPDVYQFPNQRPAADGKHARIDIIRLPTDPRACNRALAIKTVLDDLGVKYEFDETPSDPGTSFKALG